MCLVFLVAAAIIAAIVMKITGVGGKVKDLPGPGDGNKVRGRAFVCVRVLRRAGGCACCLQAQAAWQAECACVSGITAFGAVVVAC
jgi:hypothetical protein